MNDLISGNRFYTRGMICLTIVLLLALISCLPVSNKGYSSQSGWHDQSLFYTDFQYVDKHNYDLLQEPKMVGATYFTFAKLVKSLTGVDYKSSLILLNRISYIASIVLLYLIILFSLRERLHFSGYLYASLISIFTVFSTNFYYFSNIPWTHFLLNLFLILFFYSLAFAKNGNNLSFLLFGIILFFISQCRTVEFIIILMSIFLYGFYYFVINLLKEKKSLFLNIDSKKYVINIGLFIFGSILGYLSNYLLVGQSKLVVLQKIGAGRSLDLSQAPYKFIQMFFDPSFMSLYKYNHMTYDLTILADSFYIWWFPLVIQSPLLLSSLLMVFIIIVIHIKKILQILIDPIFFVSYSAAIGLIIGYCSADSAGAISLKYGFVREFIAPTFLITISFVRLCCLIYDIDEYNRNKISFSKSRILIFIFCLFNIFLLTLRSYNIYPQFNKYHLNKVDVEKELNEGQYRFHVIGVNKFNQKMSLPDFSEIQVIYKNGDKSVKKMKASKFIISKKESIKIAQIIFVPGITGQIGSPIKKEGFAIVQF